MYKIVMDYNNEQQTSGCKAPVVFKAVAGNYQVFADYAKATGRELEWKKWSEDEPCAQKDVANDLEAETSWSPFCN